MGEPVSVGHHYCKGKHVLASGSWIDVPHSHHFHKIFVRRTGLRVISMKLKAIIKNTVHIFFPGLIWLVLGKERIPGKKEDATPIYAMYNIV